MKTLSPELEMQTVEVIKETSIAAPLDLTWEAVLEEIGPGSEMPDGTPFPMKLEPYPGGRWIRDLGNNTGHLWGHVQVIKPPKLLELTGPLFVSYPCSNHVQYRLTPDADTGGTVLRITHRGMALAPADFFKGVHEGWEFALKRIAELAERRKSKGK
jgi:hypothetical protein